MSVKERANGLCLRLTTKLMLKASLFRLVKHNYRFIKRVAVHLLLVSSVGWLICSCRSNPYALTNKIYKKRMLFLTKELSKRPPIDPGHDSLNMSSPWVGAINFDLRRPSYVILHHTAQSSTEKTLKTFTIKKDKPVSAHYLIGKDGKIYHMLSNYMRAWHAGVSKWGNLTDVNSLSIGIELDNSGFEPFTEQQLQSLLKLLNNLKKNYNLPTANFIGHADVAPMRKVDPSKYFPWERLAAEGFGCWYDNLLEIPPPEFDYHAALHAIGYDTANIEAAISAFKLHFVPNELDAQLTQLDLNILYNLSQKSLD